MPPADKSELLYKRLAEHLNALPAGYPPSGDDLELRILRRLFTAAEAELAVQLTLIPETAEVIALRAGIPADQTLSRLRQLALKGLIYSIEKHGRQPLFMANQFVIGVWEYHVNDLDKDLIRDMEEYIPTLFREAWKVPQLRTIPVNRSLTPALEVMTYEKAEELIRRRGKIAVAPCICRRERTMVGQGCSKPLESCLVFGTVADYYARNGIGRIITLQEALGILRQADEAGLVLQPGNYQQAGNICCCCGCCCGVLRTLKKLPRPADHISSPFYAVCASADCNGCETCLDRCQMEAIKIEDCKAVIDLGRCIGCGLCVTTCPTAALTLQRKPAADQPVVFKTSRQTYLQLGQSRKKFRNWEILKMLVRSKTERLLVAAGIGEYYTRFKKSRK
jgi:ferredoxin